MTPSTTTECLAAPVRGELVLPRKSRDATRCDHRSRQAENSKFLGIPTRCKPVVRLSSGTRVCTAMARCPASQSSPSALRPPRWTRGGSPDAAREPDNWFTPGRDAEGTYYSPLDAIDDHNVSRLGFAWEYSSPRTGGCKALPSSLTASCMRPATGPGVCSRRDTGREMMGLRSGRRRAVWRLCPCCDVVNRGLAVWQGRIYVASVDGYLHAIDAKTGGRICAGRHAAGSWARKRSTTS